jgi:hypothetical protein
MRLEGKGVNEGVFKWVLQKYIGMDSKGDVVTGFCEYGNGPWGAIGGVVFLY